MTRKALTRIALLVFITGTLFSCVPQSKLKYVQDETTSEWRSSYTHVRPIKRIQPFDNLYIKVLSIDAETAAIFSNETMTNRPGIDINLISYTVNEKGVIDFPFVGEINVNNLTLKEAKLKIEEELSQYLSNTSITIKFVNSNITVLGEVRNQGEFPYFKDQINIFQAIGFAGGMTDYGDKSKITLIREDGDKIRYHLVNLTDKKIIETDFFYLQPNDIVIVEPINTKFRNLRTFTYSTFLATATTLVTILYFFKR
jgi:polysaccharide export outer membrane protein